jgi:hypothetical protein
MYYILTLDTCHNCKVAFFPKQSFNFYYSEKKKHPLWNKNKKNSG